MKKLALLLFVVLLVSSCATIKPPMDTEYWGFNKIEKFVPEDLYSSDDTVKAKAAATFLALPEESKRKIMTYLAYTLSDEKDPVIRAETFAALAEFKAGPYVIVPMIESARENSSALIFREVKAFISVFKPSEIELQPLVKLLSDPDYNVKLTAAKTIGLMSKRAETALPEIFNEMHKEGTKFERYVDFYNIASMINPKIAITQLMIDIKDPVKEISNNAVNKLFELYTYLSKDSPIRKEILPALTRLLYSDDEETASSSHEMVASLGDDESQKAIKAYLAYGKLALMSMAQMAGKKLQEKFNEQEQNLYDEMTVFYIQIGRRDAINTIKKK